jgi:hypothetical protein
MLGEVGLFSARSASATSFDDRSTTRLFDDQILHPHAQGLGKAFDERRVAFTSVRFEVGDVVLRDSDRFAEPLLR